MEKIKFKTFTPKDLETKMFGVTDKDEFFIVVGDSIIFQLGGYMPIAYLKDNMELPDRTKIKEVYKNCNSFDEVRSNTSIQVYPAPLPKLTLSQIKDMIGFDFTLADE